MTRAKQFDRPTIPEPVRALQETLLGRKLTAKDVEIARTSAKEYDPDPKTEKRSAKLWQPPALSAEHRQAIAATLKGRKVDLDRVYHVLEAKIDRFRKLQKVFPGKQPERRPKWLKQWKRVHKLSQDLLRALHAGEKVAYEQLPWGDINTVEPLPFTLRTRMRVRSRICLTSSSRSA